MTDGKWSRFSKTVTSQSICSESETKIDPERVYTEDSKGNLMEDGRRGHNPDRGGLAQILRAHRSEK